MGALCLFVYSNLNNMCWNISLLGREEVTFLYLSFLVNVFLFLFQFSFIYLVFTTTVTSVVLERKGELRETGQKGKLWEREPG